MQLRDILPRPYQRSGHGRERQISRGKRLLTARIDETDEPVDFALRANYLAVSLPLQVIILPQWKDRQRARIAQRQQAANWFRRNNGTVVDKYPLQPVVLPLPIRIFAQLRSRDPVRSEPITAAASMSAVTTRRTMQATYLSMLCPNLRRPNLQ